MYSTYRDVYSYAYAYVFMHMQLCIYNCMLGRSSIGAAAPEPV